MDFHNSEISVSITLTFFSFKNKFISTKLMFDIVNNYTKIYTNVCTNLFFKFQKIEIHCLGQQL